MYRAFFIFLIFSTGFLIDGFSQNLPPQIQKQIENYTYPKKIKVLGDLCWSLREENNEVAILCGRYGLNLADSLKLYSQAAEISNYLGVNMMYYILDTKQAWNYFRNALNYSISAVDSVQMGYAYDNMGYLYLINGDVINAFINERNAEKIFTRLNHKIGLAYTSGNIGLVYRELKEYDRAIEYFYKARILHSQSENEIGMAAAFSNIGQTYILKNKPDSALIYFEKQLLVSEQSGYEKSLANALKGISEILYQRGNYAASLDTLNRALQICVERNDSHLLNEIRIDKALILSKMGKIAEGKEELQKAFDLVTKLRLPKSIYQLSRGYAEFYKTVGFDHQSAKTFQELFSLYNSMYEDLMTETIKNENQKFQIADNFEHAQIEIAHKKTMEKLYFLFFIFILLVGAFLIRRSRITRMLNKKLRQKNFEIELEIHQKNQALKALEISEKELKISNETKDKFFSILAHDLKSPFNAILGFSQVLCDDYGDFSDEEKLEMARRVNEMAQRSYNLVDNLLVWSGTQTRRIVFHPEILSLKNLVHENVLLQKPQAEKKKIKIKISMADEMVFADKGMLNTILRNLISNAIKFTPENGAITLGAFDAKEPGKLAVWVEDSGIGIPYAEQEVLFEFTKVKSIPGTNNEYGTGLGLSICKEFIEIHEGTLTVESKPGEGSKFIFTLPVSRPE